VQRGSPNVIVGVIVSIVALGACGSSDRIAALTVDAGAPADSSNAPSSSADGGEAHDDGGKAPLDGASETSPPSSSLPPAPTIAVDTELCGVKAYSGTFVVKSGSTLGCSSGLIDIDADDVIVEQGGSIVVAPTSTRDGGENARPCFMNGTPYYSGASGGGYGGIGFSGGSGYAGGSTGAGTCNTCNGPVGGNVFGSANDMLVEQGSRGGEGCKGGGPSCPAGNELKGGKGGGVVRIRAKNTIRIDGEVHADGEPGENYGTPFIGGSGMAGGGSGGGILLAAPTVDLGTSAVLSTRGGAGRPGWKVSCVAQSFESNGGAGGAGRVKIATNSLSSTDGIVGAFAQGSFPP
jgi:hypothetical protein